MTERRHNEVNITTNQAPVNVDGRVEGSMNSYVNRPDTASTGELLALLDRLAGVIAEADVPRREVVEDNLADLSRDVRSVRDSGASSEVSPAVARSRWEKIERVLTPTGQLSEFGARISMLMDQLFAV